MVTIIGAVFSYITIIFKIPFPKILALENLTYLNLIYFRYLICTGLLLVYLSDRSDKVRLLNKMTPKAKVLLYIFPYSFFTE